MMIYGDLDISVLDELPPGRQEIRTDMVTSAYHARIFRFLRAALDRGEQGYIVCPLVDEGESEMKAATAYAAQLSETELFGYNLGLLHGKMTPKQKDAVMQAFARGDVQVLVATTVVEVGVDVPNATVMIVENAERFGKTKSPDVSNKRNIRTLFFLSIRKKHSQKILFGKTSFRNYQSSRRWFLGMNSLSPCFTPNASYHASM